MNAADFFTLPAGKEMPTDLVYFAHMILGPLGQPDFASMGPTWEDFMTLSTRLLAQGAGLPPTHPEARHGGAVFCALCEGSGLVEVDDCEEDEECNGAHPIRLTFKGEMFLAYAGGAK